MAVTLNLKPEIEAGLLAQARAAGLPLEEFLAQHLEVLAEASDVVSLQIRASGDVDQWEQELIEWLDSFPQVPVLSEEAFKRENWYPDRW